ncbi:MAG TPA: MarR family transcriptional regulator [Candidatus Ozemobacteraceae bacterium]|nr:MarR family transcriptional regulator [Candidatus Ozemobacteraceae bacterium]HQG30047.1 MarR family transcriptional regulator [Candidatus Ozemobacteraceae bacterium]
MSKDSVELFHSLIQTTKTVVRSVFAGSGLGPHTGLTGPQFGLLATLHRKGPLSPSEMCEIMMVTPANITGMISRLKKLGLVERRRLSSDRRCLKIDLSPQGREKIVSLIPIWQKSADSCFSRFPAGQRRALIDLLETFRESVIASSHATAHSGGDE